jgi:magnesium transporter
MIRFNYKPPGTPPATLSSPEGAREKPVLRLVRFDEASFFDETFESLEVLLLEYDPAKVNWIDIDGLGNVPLLEAVAARFKLHPLAIEDVLNTAQRPKIEAFEDHYPKNGSWVIAFGAEVACLWGNGTRFNRLKRSPSG